MDSSSLDLWTRRKVWILIWKQYNFLKDKHVALSFKVSSYVIRLERNGLITSHKEYTKLSYIIVTVKYCKWNPWYFSWVGLKLLCSPNISHAIKELQLENKLLHSLRQSFMEKTWEGERYNLKTKLRKYIERPSDLFFFLCRRKQDKKGPELQTISINEEEEEPGSVLSKSTQTIADRKMYCVNFNVLFRKFILPSLRKGREGYIAISSILRTLLFSKVFIVPWYFYTLSTSRKRSMPTFHYYVYYIIVRDDPMSCPTDNITPFCSRNLYGLEI